MIKINGGIKNQKSKPLFGKGAGRPRVERKVASREAREGGERWVPQPLRSKKKTTRRREEGARTDFFEKKDRSRGEKSHWPAGLERSCRK